MRSSIRRRMTGSAAAHGRRPRGWLRRGGLRLTAALAIASVITIASAEPARASRAPAVAEQVGHPPHRDGAADPPAARPTALHPAHAVAAPAGPATATDPPAVSAAGAGDAAAPPGRAGHGGTAAVPTPEPWRWPTAPVHVLAEFAVPAHDYAPGHRGMDLAAVRAVRSPADGVVAFSGVVVDRPLVTIDHGDGLVTTLEPVEAGLSPGDAVAAGDAVGSVASGGHAPPGAVHFGVRLHGDYINPRLLLGGVPRAVLLPCC